MGFSVSGSFAVVAIASFMALGMFYSSAAIGFELVQEAQQDAHDSQLAQQNTAIEITEANWTTASGCSLSTCLVIEANNTGTTALSLNSTDLLVDGYYVDRDDYTADQVDGDGDTELWLPDETYRIEVSRPVLNQIFDEVTSFPPSRVVLNTEHGVSDARSVEDDTVG